MNRWPFFTNRQARRNDQRLYAGKSDQNDGLGIEEGRTSVKLLMKNVQPPRYPFMTKPARMHFISEIPEPAAYRAKDRTRYAAVKENMAYRRHSNQYASLGPGANNKVFALTAHRTYMNHCRTANRLHGTQELQPISSSVIFSQQQNSWLSHQPSLQ